MSVHKQAGRWRVKWREAGRQRSVTLPLGTPRREADDLERKIKTQLRTGTVSEHTAGEQRLQDFGVEWYDQVAPGLAENTLRGYEWAWDRWILPRLGTFRLRDLTVERVDVFSAALARAGAGPATIRKVLVVLGSVLGLAVKWGRMPANPVAHVSKPSAARERAVTPWPPLVIEGLRRALADRGDTPGVLLVALMGYAGLRPEEALALTWDHVRAQTILIDRAAVFGVEKQTKTRAHRTVDLLPALREDLEAARHPGGLVLPKPKVGGLWSDADYRNWRVDRFQPAAVTVGLASITLTEKPGGGQRREYVGPRPYDLRHSFVSMLIAAGLDVVSVAAQAGHSPEMCLRTYAHVFAEAKGTRVDPTVEIRRARETVWQ